MAIHPVTIKNTFARHFVFWSLFVPLITIIFLPMIFPDQSINENEVKMVEVFDVDLKKLTERANGVFGSVFVETGVMSASEDFFTGKNSSTLMKPNSDFAGKWIRGIWLMIYKAIWRLFALISIFFIPALAICIPSAIDGFTVRARKKYRFENYNPIFFYSSMHSFTFVLGLFVFLPLAPITLSATLLALMLVGMALAVWVAASNFQTGS